MLYDEIYCACIFLSFTILSVISRHIIKEQKWNAATSAYGKAMSSTGAEPAHQIMHLYHDQNLYKCKNCQHRPSFQAVPGPLLPICGSTFLEDVCHNYVAFTYPSVSKGHIKMTLTNIILIATCVICKVRVRDDLINHEYLFLIISNIQYGLSKEDFVDRFVYLSS